MLMACFADTNVSQGTVATYARSGGNAYNQFIANLRGNLPVKKFGKSVKIWQNYRHKFCVPAFLRHPVYGVTTGRILYTMHCDAA